MYHIEIQNELEQLLSLVAELDVEDSASWRVQVKGSLNHWHDLRDNLEQFVAEETIYFDTLSLDDEIDVYQYLEQEILFKQTCLDLTYLIRLAYDLGVERRHIIEIYRYVVNLWLGYADLVSQIQQLGEMQGTQPLVLDVDYSTALLLTVCAIKFEDSQALVQIVDGLMCYQQDKLLDILHYAYFENPSISEHYHVTYPFQQLNEMLEQGVNEQTVTTYLNFIQKEQASGRYFEKKKFHKVSLLGQWSFEIVAICAVYQLDVNLFKDFKSVPDCF